MSKAMFENTQKLQTICPTSKINAHMLQLLHTVSEGSEVEKNPLKDSCTSTVACHCLFSREKTQQGCFAGFVLPLLCAHPDSAEPSWTWRQPFLIRSGGQSNYSSSLFLLIRLDSYQVFQELPNLPGYRQTQHPCRSSSKAPTFLHNHC